MWFGLVLRTVCGTIDSPGSGIPDSLPDGCVFQTEKIFVLVLSMPFNVSNERPAVQNVDLRLRIAQITYDLMQFSHFEGSQIRLFLGFSVFF